MPTLDYGNQPDAVKMMVDTALYWITNYDFDGFRHDATKHIPNVFWETLTQRLKTEVMIPRYKQVYQIGETFGSRELINSYVSSGQLDAQFDFNLYFDARSAFATDEEGFQQLKSSIDETLDYYGYHSLMGNITGNHDMARFITLASGDVKFNEDQKAAGWSRQVEITNEVGYKRLMQLQAFLLTMPGIPVIYYGDEIGMPGADDPDNRRPMKFANLDGSRASGERQCEKTHPPAPTKHGVAIWRLRSPTRRRQNLRLRPHLLR